MSWKSFRNAIDRGKIPHFARGHVLGKIGGRRFVPVVFYEPGRRDQDYPGPEPDYPGPERDYPGPEPDYPGPEIY